MAEPILREAADKIRVELCYGGSAHEFYGAIADWLDLESREWDDHYDEQWFTYTQAWGKNNDTPMPTDIHALFRTNAAEFADAQHRPALRVASTFLDRSVSDAPEARRCWCGGKAGFRADKGYIDCLVERAHDWRGRLA